MVWPGREKERFTSFDPDKCGLLMFTQVMCGNSVRTQMHSYLLIIIITYLLLLCGGH